MGMAQLEIIWVYYRFRSEGEDRAKLPCVTVRPMAAYKFHGFYFDQKLYDNNTFRREDIFINSTVEKLKNSTIYTTKVSRLLLNVLVLLHFNQFIF